MITPVLSKTFAFAGTVGVSAFPAAGTAWRDIGWAVAPWESVPISMLGVCLDLNVVTALPQSGGPCALGGFVGSSYTPDQLTPMRRSTCPQPGSQTLGLSVDVMYPAGCGFAFPALVGSPDPVTGPHLDCHVFGTPGLGYSGFITVFYCK